jgi:hypothetical protein
MKETCSTIEALMTATSGQWAFADDVTEQHFHQATQLAESVSKLMIHQEVASQTSRTATSAIRALLSVHSWSNDEKKLGGMTDGIEITMQHKEKSIAGACVLCVVPHTCQMGQQRLKPSNGCHWLEGKP